MADITLLELHLEDASFSAKAPFSGRGEDETVEEDGGSGRKLFALLALGAVLGLAWYAARNGVGERIDIDEEIEIAG